MGDTAEGAVDDASDEAAADVGDDADDALAEVGSAADTPRLASRILVTWVEIIVVGLGGAALGSTVSGPPGLIVYLATVLASISVLLYNVDQLIQGRLADHGG